MKQKPKHSSVQRLYWKNAMKRWRAANPEKNREIHRRYLRRKRERQKLEHELVKQFFGEIWREKE